MDRRRFLTAAGVLSLGAAAGLTACSSSGGSTSAEAAGTGGSGGGGSRKVNLGFIALTDSASIIMAKELGYFDELDLDVTISKQASWPALRDALLNGQIDGAHCLYSMPLAVATGIGGDGSTDLKVAMMLNQNGQGITLSNDFSEIGYGDPTKAKSILEGKDAPQLAMTFPGGTHDLWLRYWLAATGADTSKVAIQPIPPPNMVQNMSAGTVQGYCVGEPWNAVAVKQGIGFTHLATQDLWLNHPEKALVAGTGLQQQPEVLVDVMRAVLRASKWLDEPANRSEAAETIGVEGYVNAPPEEIRGRLTGVYDLGADLGEKDFEGSQMQFFRDGEVNAPRQSHMIWALAQYVRLGLLPEAPDYTAVAAAAVVPDLYAEAAAAESVDVPDDDMAPFEVVLDGVTFDPTDPDAEAERR